MYKVNSKTIKRIQKFDWVSFDIFDTLIRRCVPHPTDLFTLVGMKYNALHPQQPIADFKKMRVKAEGSARERSSSEEIQLDDIYNSIPLPENVKAELKRMEMEAECDVCKPNETVVALFNECIRQNKNVVIASDMYLPKEDMERLLRIGQMRHEPNAAARWCFGNVRVATDGTENIKPVKNRSIDRIDMTVAWINAVAVARQRMSMAVNVYAQNPPRMIWI